MATVSDVVFQLGLVEASARRARESLSMGAELTVASQRPQLAIAGRLNGVHDPNVQQAQQGAAMQNSGMNETKNVLAFAAKLQAILAGDAAQPDQPEGD